MMEKTLPEVCIIQYGFPFDSSKFCSAEGVPLVRIRDVVRGYSETYTTEIAGENYIVNDGDLLIGMDGEFNIAYWKGGRAYLNQRVCRLIPREDVDRDYIFYYMPQALKAIEDATPFVTVKHLSAKQLSKILIPLPDMREQQRISAVLRSVDRVIAMRKKELDELNNLVKSRFIELFGAISEEVPLSYYIGGLNAGKSLAGEEENPNKVLKTGAVTYDHFDETQIKNLPIDYEPQENHRVKAGDVIISRMNTAELVGAAAYVWDVPEHIYLPDRLWRAEIKETANPIFVWQVLIQSSTKESIRRIASGTSGSMKNISKPGLLGIRVVKAPIELQLQFAAFVEQTDKSKLAVQKGLQELEILKKSLMQQYFG